MKLYLDIQRLNLVYTHGDYYGIKDIIPKSVDVYV